MSEVYQIGRMVKGGQLAHVFNIRRTDKGGIKISKVEGLATSERQELHAHFGRPIQGRTGGRLGDGTFWEGFKEMKPGTEEHFQTAVRRLPGTFKVMS